LKLNSADVEERLKSVRYYLGYAELFVCIALSRNLSKVVCRSEAEDEAAKVFITIMVQLSVVGIGAIVLMPESSAGDIGCVVLRQGWLPYRFARGNYVK
jgi:hypothetical protein